MCRLRGLLLAGIVALYCLPTSKAAYNDSIFNAGNYYPGVWWSVAKTDVPAIASNALILRQNTIEPDNFAKNVILGIANNQRDAVSDLTASELLPQQPAAPLGCATMLWLPAACEVSAAGKARQGCLQAAKQAERYWLLSWGVL